MRTLFTLLLLAGVSCTPLPKIGTTYKVCWHCNHGNGEVYYRGKKYEVKNTSTGSSYIIVRHKKVLLQKKQKTTDEVMN